MAERSVEDQLRQEYFELLPEIRRVVEHLEAEVRHCVLPISLTLDEYERLVVTSRIKECESALDALRRRQEGATFDRDRPELYTLTSLNDLAGVRVLAFPRSRLREIDQQLRGRFPSWEQDAVPGSYANDEPLAFKCCGYCEASQKVRGEFQVVSMLTGLFWEVEHSAIYKPTPRLKGIAGHYRMQARTLEVYKALQAFEEEFENLIRSDPLGIRKEEEQAS
jgi:ppGpp synthetase/RelA/SpoT-type nucleotidyltranferase